MNTRDARKYGGRLLRLAAFLEKLPRERFDYGCWVGEGWEGRDDLSCGTTACALGWATTIPEFRRLGLRLEWSDLNSVVHNIKDGSYCELAACRPFGLSPWEADELFIPSGSGRDSPGPDPTPKQVASYIRKFVAHKYPGVKFE